LGYADDGDRYWHPSRTVIFLGDFIDRGPRQREAVNIARAMVRRGTALAVMGNHEFNALAYHAPDPQRPGEYLRPHTDKNRQQHPI
jgi:calcineurin-like phosphoesterase family protein